MTRPPKPPPPPDPRSVGEVVLHALLATCGDDPVKLRNVLAGFRSGTEIEKGIRKRLESLHLPGLGGA